MQSKTLGYSGEKLAVEYLIKKGYQIIDRNFTVRGGEIDIVAKEKDIIVFVEVKTRTGELFGAGEDSYTKTKAKRVQRAIEQYLDRKMSSAKDPDYRIDLIEIDIDPNSKVDLQINPAPSRIPCAKSAGYSGRCWINHFEDIEL